MVTLHWAELTLIVLIVVALGFGVGFDLAARSNARDIDDVT